MIVEIRETEWDEKHENGAGSHKKMRMMVGMQRYNALMR